MLIKIMKNDFLRKKTITIAVFSLMTISTTLIASGSRLFVDLAFSIDALIRSSRSPHFAQFHSGPVDQGSIAEWVRGNGLVEEYQIVELVNIDESELDFHNDAPSKKGSVMEYAFVKQNASFDFLLDAENSPLSLASGEIALPIFTMKREGLSVGDTMSVSDGDFRMDFTIAAFARDAQMNPSIVSSKRFLVSDEDFRVLRDGIGEQEHLIEFRLSDPERLEDFRGSYIASGLPQLGPSIDIGLIRLINGFTDGLVASAIILVSLVLGVVASLCMRLTIAATLEEDFREIGVMKGIGVAAGSIRLIYLGRYTLLLVLSGVVGYSLSFAVGRVFLGDMILYLGGAGRGAVGEIIPGLAVSAALFFIFATCFFAVRRFEKISAMEAIRIGFAGESSARRAPPALRPRAAMSPNHLLALRDIALRSRSFLLLFFVFFISALVVVVPLNFLSTVKDSRFVQYMGIGRSDLIVDLRRTSGMPDRYRWAMEYLERDGGVERFSGRVTCRYAARSGATGAAGEVQEILVETGDFSAFPIEYLAGTAPLSQGSIALSALGAQDFSVRVGDELSVIVGEAERKLRVSGIYQDLSNGGRTAKAPIEADDRCALWYTLYVDVNGDVAEKRDELSAALGPAKVTDVESYCRQTFAQTISQLGLFTAVAWVAASLTAMLIAALFLKMLVSKDLSEIAILRSLGFSPEDIRGQYLTRILSVLVVGIAAGTAAANTLGEALVACALSLFGAPGFRFYIDPLRSYALLPLSMVALVSAAAFAATGAIGRFRVSDLTIE